MAKFCPNCGERVEENIAFCPECGQKFEAAPAQPQQPMQQEQFNQPVQPQQPMQQGQFNQPVQPQQPVQQPMQQPGQPMNYQNGYNPYGQQQPNGFQQPPYGGVGVGPLPDNIAQAFKWTTYTGRLNRQRYFFRGLGLGFLAFVILMVVGTIGIAGGMKEELALGLGFLLAMPLIVLSLFNSIKRAHDLDKPGWLAIVQALPGWVDVFTTNQAVTVVAGLVGLILGIYLLFFKGTEGPNQYGDDPLRY